jgi:SnoaL-like domain
MDITDLLAEREIYRNLVHFAQAMDDRNWAQLDEFTTTDIAADLGTGKLSGRADMVAVMRQFLDQCGTTQHMLGNVLIDVNGDTARSQAYVADMHLGGEGAEDITFRTLGRYLDKWCKVDGRWLMCERIKENRATVGSLAVFGFGQGT